LQNVGLRSRIFFSQSIDWSLEIPALRPTYLRFNIHPSDPVRRKAERGQIWTANPIAAQEVSALRHSLPLRLDFFVTNQLQALVLSFCPLFLPRGGNWLAGLLHVANQKKSVCFAFKMAST
jgi:hypothetical protein